MSDEMPPMNDHNSAEATEKGLLPLKQTPMIEPENFDLRSHDAAGTKTRRHY
jgi:hypothetical protein